MRSLPRLILWIVLLISLLAACNLVGSDDDNEEAAPDAADVPTLAPETTEVAAGDLTVEINSPTEGSEVLVNTDVLVYSVARDTMGVTRIELRADGELVDTLESPISGGQRELFVLQTWQPTNAGPAVLEVTAYRGTAASTRDSVQVTVRAEQAEIRTPAPTPTVVAPEATANTTCRARINISALNLRTAPGLNSTIQSTLSLGVVVPLIGRTGDNQWWQVRAEGRAGWISAVYTTLLGNCAGVPVTGEVTVVPTPTATTVPLQPTATNTVTPSPSPLEAACVAQVLRGDVPVRNAPDTDANAIRSLAANERRPAIARTSDNAWIQITGTDGVTGWVAAADLALFGECDDITIQEVALAPQNQSPTISNIPPQSLTEGATQPVNFAVSDPDGDAVSLAVASTDGRVVRAIPLDGNTIRLEALQGGTTNVQITATDGRGGTTTRAFNVVVLEPANQPPTLADIPDQTVPVDETITVPVETSDPEGENVVLSAESADTGVIVAAPDGRGNITLRGVRPGSVEIRVTANDLEGGRTSVSFSATAVQPEPENQPPLISPVLRQTLNPDETRAIPVGTRDPEGGPVRIVDASAAAPGIIAASVGEDGSSVVLAAQGPGETTITFTVEDDAGATAQESFGVTVLQPAEPEPENQPPTLTTPEALELAVDETTTLPLQANDPDGDPLTITALDAAPGGLLAAQPASDDLAVTLVALAPGEATLSITVSDPNGASASAEVTVTIPEPPNQPPTIGTPDSFTLEPGDTITLVIPADDPDGDPLSITDVSVSPENIINAEIAPEGLAVVIEAVGDGLATLSVTVADPAGATASANFPVPVLTPTPEPTEPPTQEPTEEPTP
ncbi:MAG: Ig-like domain-containing protein, partial [Anaerolineales bacterium]